MKKMHIILLEEPGKSGTPEDTITVYVSRHGSRHDALLRMHMQGILPKYRVVSHTTAPALRTLIFMWFPTLEVIKFQFKKLTLMTWLKYWVALPLAKLFTGSTRKNWQNIGQYDQKTKRVFPVPDGEKLHD